MERCYIGRCLAGVVFMMLEMLLLMFFTDQSPWGPPRMMAAMVLGKEVLPPPATFDVGIMMVAMMVHIPLSIIYGVVIGWITHRFNNTGVLMASTLFGLFIYFINFYLIAPLVFPWFTEAQNWVSLVSHLIYGFVLGSVYVGFRRDGYRTRNE